MISYRLDIRFSSPVAALPFNGSEAVESIGADRLFSWICLGWSTLFGAEKLTQEIITPYLTGQGPWKHSDLFPADSSAIYVPILAGKDFASRSIESSQTHLEPEQLESKLQTTMISRVKRAELKSAKNGTAIMQKSVFNAVALDESMHEDKSAQWRFTALFQFSQDDAQISSKLLAVLNYLKDDGLGAMRSVGAGAIREISLSPQAPESIRLCSHNGKQICEAGKNIDSTKHHLLLSPCCPDQAMLDLIESSAPGSNSYKIQRSSGWIYDSNGQATNIKKPHSATFTTGSIFANKPSGRLLDLSIDSHPCYRYGIPFSVEIDSCH